MIPARSYNEYAMLRRVDDKTYITAGKLQFFFCKELIEIEYREKEDGKRFFFDYENMKINRAQDR